HPFQIARTATTQAEFATFVEDAGYLRRELWSDEGWHWRQKEGAEQPVYWRRDESGWARPGIRRGGSLGPYNPGFHFKWYEADAFCRWAGRRLPTEAEWEMAASWDPIDRRKRRYPWGDDPPTPDRANLDWTNMDTLDVSVLPDGDSPSGCRQMIGNTWEWT